MTKFPPAYKHLYQPGLLFLPFVAERIDQDADKLACIPKSVGCI